MMSYLTTEELKECQLGILDFIVEVCHQHQLHYFLNYGSLIGAIRHQGMIPWDDDIDLSMYREDYEQFAKIVKEMDHPRYRVLDFENTSWYFQNFMVVVDTDTVIEDDTRQQKQDTHVFVDIFPIDRFDDLAIIDKAHLYVTLRHLSYARKAAIQHGDAKWKDWARLIVWYALKPVNPRWFTKKISRLIERYQRPDGQYEAAIGVGKDRHKERVPAGTFRELMPTLFEGKYYNIPVNYDLFLRQMYGDYMKIPSIEEQQYSSHHLTVKWAKERK